MISFKIESGFHPWVRLCEVISEKLGEDARPAKKKHSLGAHIPYKGKPPTGET